MLFKILGFLEDCIFGNGIDGGRYYDGNGNYGKPKNGSWKANQYTTTVYPSDYKVYFTDGRYEYIYNAYSKNHARKIALGRRNGRIKYVESV